MLKKRKCERIPHSQFHRCSALYLIGIYFDVLYFSSLIIRKNIAKLLLALVIIRLQHRTSKTKNNRYNLMIESLLSNNTSNRFKFIMTPTLGKNLLSPSQKRNNDPYFQENQGLQTICFLNLCQVSLKSGQVTGDSKGTKGATSGVNIYYLRHLIKPQVVHKVR